jgi:hypothetical protein
MAFRASGLVSKGRRILRDDVHDRLVRVFDDAVIIHRHVQADVRRLPQSPAGKAGKADNGHPKMFRRRHSVDDVGALPG